MRTQLAGDDPIQATRKRPPMFLHATARALPGLRPFESDAAARRLMECLRRAWPSALAASVMPNHLHLVVEAEDAARERARLARAAAAFSRHLGRGRIWVPIPEPTRVADCRHLQRTVRYVLLNPCRAGLVSDPLCWPHSTLRGVLGAEYDAWVSAAELAAALGPRPEFRDWFHRYVAADSRIPPEARKLLRPARPSEVPCVLLSDIVAASVCATPWSPPSVQRLAVVLLARSQGWRDMASLTSASGLSERQIRRLAGRTEHSLLAAAALCLGDPRLRVTLKPNWQ